MPAQNSIYIRVGKKGWGDGELPPVRGANKANFFVEPPELPPKRRLGSLATGGSQPITVLRELDDPESFLLDDT